MPMFVRKVLIFMTGYAWLLLVAGMGLMGVAVWSQWKAEGDHAYKSREQLETLVGIVASASEVTVKRKRVTTKKYYELTVTPTAGGEQRKLRVDHSTPSTVVSNLIDEHITALFDADENDTVYEVVTEGKVVIAYESTQQRLLGEATTTARFLGSAGMWALAALLALLGAAGVWANRKLRCAYVELHVIAN